MNDAPSSPVCLAQLTFVNGGLARQSVALPEAPLMIGRAPECQMRLTEKGVWERHAQIRLRPGEGFFLHSLPPATVSVNRQPVTAPQLLRNGDTIDAGEVKLRFWLGPVRQAPLPIIEAVFWLLLGALFAVQAWLIWAL